MTCVHYRVAASSSPAPPCHSRTLPPHIFAAGFEDPNCSPPCPPSPHVPTVCIIPRDIEAICKILYKPFLSSCVFTPAPMFFSLFIIQESHCTSTSTFLFLSVCVCVWMWMKKSVCVCVFMCGCMSVYAKIRYTREVKNHSYASCELLWLRWCYLPCK